MQTIVSFLTDHGFEGLVIIALFGYLKLEIKNLKERHKELREDCKDWNNLLSGKTIKGISKNGRRE